MALCALCVCILSGSRASSFKARRARKPSLATFLISATLHTFGILHFCIAVDFDKAIAKMTSQGVWRNTNMQIIILNAVPNRSSCFCLHTALVNACTVFWDSASWSFNRSMWAHLLQQLTHKLLPTGQLLSQINTRWTLMCSKPKHYALQLPCFKMHVMGPTWSMAQMCFQLATLMSSTQHWSQVHPKPCRHYLNTHSSSHGGDEILAWQAKLSTHLLNRAMSLVTSPMPSVWQWMSFSWFVVTMLNRLVNSFYSMHW